MRPNCLRTTASILVTPFDIYYKWRCHESCATRRSARIEPFSFPKNNAGAFLPNLALSRVFAVLAIASWLSAGQLWAQSQADKAGSGQTESSEKMPQSQSGCIGALVERINFPGVAQNDQQMLRDMLPVKEGKPLDREQLQESMRILFGTGRFADLKAECERTPDGKVTLSFPNSPKYFIGLVRADGAPGHPTESQIVNASKLQLGEPFTPEKASRAVQNIKRLLEENEYYKAEISSPSTKIRRPNRSKSRLKSIPATPPVSAPLLFRPARLTRSAKSKTSHICIQAT